MLTSQRVASRIGLKDIYIKHLLQCCEKRLEHGFEESGDPVKKIKLTSDTVRFASLTVTVTVMKQS